MSNIYTLDRQEDFFNARELLRDKHLALIGAGKSKDQYKFNLSKVVCLWVNPRPDWGEIVHRVYGEAWKGKHIACISGLHPELIQPFQERHPEADIFTFSCDRNNPVNAYGTFPAFLHYFVEMLKFDESVSCILDENARILYISGCDMIPEPGEYRNFDTEILGIKKVCNSIYPFEPWNKIVYLCGNYRLFNFISNFNIHDKDHILLYPESDWDNNGRRK